MSEESLSISRKVSEIFETSENMTDIVSKLKDLDKKSDSDKNLIKTTASKFVDSLF